MRPPLNVVPTHACTTGSLAPASVATPLSTHTAIAHATIHLFISTLLCESSLRGSSSDGLALVSGEKSEGPEPA